MKNPMKDFRKQYSLTQKEAAKTLGFNSVRSLQYIEAGERPISGTVQKAMLYYTRYKFAQAHLDRLTDELEWEQTNE